MLWLLPGRTSGGSRASFIWVEHILCWVTKWNNVLLKLFVVGFLWWWWKRVVFLFLTLWKEQKVDFKGRIISLFLNCSELFCSLVAISFWMETLLNYCHERSGRFSIGKRNGNKISKKFSSKAWWIYHILKSFYKSLFQRTHVISCVC